MVETELVESVERQEWLDAAAEPLQAAVGKVFSGGEGARTVEDLLHGAWLGHPLHPVITDVPVGSWTAALVLDALEMKGRREFAGAADVAVSIGLAGAVAAAVTGLTDWQYTSGRTRRLGMAHALVNSTAALLYATSLVMRKRGARRAGRALSTMGYATMSAGASLGGELVFKEHVGVNRATDTEFPEAWVPVLPEKKLKEGKPTRVEAEGAPVVLIRQGKWISALAATCSHTGGPLDEGEFENGCLTCPWHGSTFNVDDGGVVHGPASFPQPVLDARVSDGQIEVRLARR